MGDVPSVPVFSRLLIAYLRQVIATLNREELA
jgi:hypothetical protein